MERQKMNRPNGWRKDGDLVGWEGEEKGGVSLYDLVEWRVGRRGIYTQPGLLSDPKIRKISQKFMKHLLDLNVCEVCGKIKYILMLGM